MPNIVTEGVAKLDDASMSQLRIDDPEVCKRPSEVFESRVLNELSLTEESAKELATESMLDFLWDEETSQKNASASDTSLNEFFKGLDS